MEKPSFISAKNPFTNEGVNYHLRIAPQDIAKTVILPGDPDRVQMISTEWDEAQQVGKNREFITHTGKFHGQPLSTISTGIGNPAMATVVESLARLGARNLLRIGTTGCIQPGIELGDVIISTGAVRLDGASKAYIRPEYPAVAHPEVVMAMVWACEELRLPYHLGITASTDSWYLGQGRPGFNDYFPSFSRELLADMQAAGVVNFEMETSALLTVSGIYGLRAGAIFAVVANRMDNIFEVKGVEQAISAVNLAAIRLLQMDKQRELAGAKLWHPGLIRGGHSEK